MSQSMSKYAVDDAPGAANNGAWTASWQRHEKYGKVFRAYSRAGEYTGRRSLPELWDISNGCILWLPARADINDKIIENSILSSKGNGFFDHPVIVLKVMVASPTTAILTCAKMTSLGKRTLHQAFPSNAHRWSQYLPIAPAAAHPVNGIQLHLENEKPKRGMPEISYISLKETFDIDFTALRCYPINQKADGYRHRLNKNSFEQLLHAMDFESGPWIETDSLWETFEKHLELAVEHEGTTTTANQADDS